MTPKQFEALVADADQRLSQLKVLYDQWFAGVERLEPARERQEFELLLRKLRAEHPSNTAARFRIDQLNHRFLSFATYWRRIGRQIEEGTYRRDQLKARRRRDTLLERNEPAQATALELDAQDDLDMDALLEEASASPGPLKAGGRMAAQVPIPSASVVAGPDTHTTTNASGAFSLRRPQAVTHSIPRPGNSRPGNSPPGGTRKAATGMPPLPQAPQATAGATRPKPPPPQSPPGPPRAAASTTPLQQGGRPRAPHVAPPRPPPPIATTQAGRPAGRTQPDLSDAHIRAIYDRYVDARRRNQERTDNVDLATVARNVRGALPKLANKHAGKRIDFDVVLKDGKVALKPVAR